MPKRPKKSDLDTVPRDKIEIQPVTPITVPETHRLFRLTPVGEDLAQPHLQIALVASDSETEARALAASHDPFGRPWTDERK